MNKTITNRISKSDILLTENMDPPPKKRRNQLTMDEVYSINFPSSILVSGFASFNKCRRNDYRK